MSRYPVSRRTFMKGAAGSVALTSFGAPFGAQQAFAANLANEELRTVGLSVTVQERILADFKAASGVKAVSGKGAIFPDTQTELLSGSRAPMSFSTRPIWWLCPRSPSLPSLPSRQRRLRR